MTKNKKLRDNLWVFFSDACTFLSNPKYSDYNKICHLILFIMWKWVNAVNWRRTTTNFRKEQNEWWKSDFFCFISSLRPILLNSFATSIYFNSTYMGDYITPKIIEESLSSSKIQSKYSWIFIFNYSSTHISKLTYTIFHEFLWKKLK